MQPVRGHGYFGATLREHAAAGLKLVWTCHRAHEALPWHRHQAAYVTLVVAGGYREILASGSSALGSGEAVIHPPGEQHGDVFADQGAELLNIELDDAALVRLGPAAAVFATRKELPAGTAEPLLGRLLAELRAPDELTSLMVDAALLDLGARILRRDSPPGRAAPAWLLQLDRLLAARFLEPWSLADLAAEVNVHPHHLSRGVRRHRHTSVGAWLRRLRTEHAAQLLRSPLPLAEVALQAGFCDQSHLTRCFVRRFGTTPAAWRRAHLAGRPQRPS